MLQSTMRRASEAKTPEFPANFGATDALRENASNCHSEPRSFFERGEESAFILVACKKQIPRFARDDNVLFLCSL
jgi:hypothetical protein